MLSLILSTAIAACPIYYGKQSAGSWSFSQQHMENRVEPGTQSCQLKVVDEKIVEVCIPQSGATVTIPHGPPDGMVEVETDPETCKPMPYQALKMEGGKLKADPTIVAQVKQQEAMEKAARLTNLARQTELAKKPVLTNPELQELTQLNAKRQAGEF